MRYIAHISEHTKFQQRVEIITDKSVSSKTLFVYHIIENDINLSKILKTRPPMTRPTVVFTRKKTISNYLVQTDIIPRKKQRKGRSTCRKCKSTSCANPPPFPPIPLINSSKIVQSKHKNITAVLTERCDC